MDKIVRNSIERSSRQSSTASPMWLAVFLLGFMLLAACGGGGSPTATAIPATAAVQPTSTSASEPTGMEATAYPAPQVQSQSTDAYPAPQQAAVNPAYPAPGGEASPTSEVVLPLALTPSQTEGPYYPVSKLDDTDNDLTIVSDSDAAAQGEVLLLSGRVLDENGQPIEDVTVQIWQTDNQGFYMHPDDPNTDQRDPNFQFYGESVTTADGSYGFRTILPGLYEPRPRHIHVKVLKDGETLLTTQFYFAGDDRLANDAVSAGVSAELTLTPQTVEDEAGNPAMMAQKDIVLPAQ